MGLSEIAARGRRPSLFLPAPDIDMLIAGLQFLRREQLAQGPSLFGDRSIVDVILTLSRHRQALREWYGYESEENAAYADGIEPVKGP